MPLLRRFYALPAVTTRTAATRPYTSLLSKLSDTVAAKVSQMTEDVWLAEEKLVTEPRRKIKPQHALTQSLAERLAAQRNVKQRLVPTSIKVDKSRQYVEFTWPAEAAEVMREVSLEAEEAAPVAAAAAATTAAAASPLPRQEQPSNAADRSAMSSSTPISSSPFTSSYSAASPAFQTRGARQKPHNGAPTVPLRTRALAEYLRAYTPSTDGALGAKDIVIYGRRGITISQIVPIGNYALRFVFSDNHAGGIYSYEYLFYLTGPSTKYGLMRAYVRDLKQRRKSRDPPRRAPSRRHAKDSQPADNNSREARKR